MNITTNLTTAFLFARRLASLVAFVAVGLGSHSAFAADATARVASLPYRPDKGGVVITFDDRTFDNWVKAMPLFDKYGVTATFFISGVIDRQAIDAARQLKSHGQAIGCHGVHHLKAVEYSQQRSADDYVRDEALPQVAAFEAAGITVTAFAYPNSRNDAATDRALLKIFRHVRTGGSVAPGEQISKKDTFFVPADKVGGCGCLYGKGIDDAPNKEDRTYEQLDAALARAAKNTEIIVLYAHNIASSGKGHHVAPAALEHVFRKATELELKFYTFDQLPALARPGQR